ncbi:MAG TPA: DUF924 family protein [Candidatus Paceibacterota bacterium]
MAPKKILNFWFGFGFKEHFGKDRKFDALICKRFLKLHEATVRGELVLWRTVPRGRLAQIIVLDQFSRNMFRGTPQAFASDTLALALAQEAMAIGADKKLSKIERQFFLFSITCLSTKSQTA